MIRQPVAGRNVTRAGEASSINLPGIGAFALGEMRKTLRQAGGGRRAIGLRIQRDEGVEVCPLAGTYR